MAKTPIYVDVPDPYDDSGLQQRLAAIESRVSALESVPEPPLPEPEPPVPSPAPEPSSKKILQGHMLNPIGGFRVPGGSDTGGRSIKWASGGFDLNPVTGHWAVSHSLAVIDCVEPGTMGDLSLHPSEWPALEIVRHATLLGDDPEGAGANRLTPEGVFWLDENTVVGSGRRGYRGGYDSQWIAKVNLETGEETRFAMASDAENQERYGYDTQLLFAAGFTRIAESWADQHNYGNCLAMASGGYTTLGSPYGPSLALWSEGEQFPVPLMAYYPAENQAVRDSAYIYPNKESGQLGIWKDPEGFRGFWQAAPVSRGAAWIDHPEVKGIVYTSVHGRGFLDYRTQGATGGGLAAFCVEEPLDNYTQRRHGNGRANMGLEYWNADGPKGFGIRTIHVYDPDEIAKVLAGELEPHEPVSITTKLPIDGLPVLDDGKTPTSADGVVWDHRRQLLWISFRFLDGSDYALVAYEIVPEATKPKIQLRTPEGWHLNETGQFERINPIGTVENGLTAVKQASSVELEWNDTNLEGHIDWQVMRSVEERSGWEVIATVSDTEWTDESPLQDAYYLVVDRVDSGGIIQVHDIRGKVRVK